jgi:hypothetical protein
MNWSEPMTFMVHLGIVIVIALLALFLVAHANGDRLHKELEETRSMLADQYSRISQMIRERDQAVQDRTRAVDAMLVADAARQRSESILEDARAAHDDLVRRVNEIKDLFGAT